MLNDERLLENVRLAVGCGARGAQLLTVALGSMGDVSSEHALDRLARLREDILRLEGQTPVPHRELAELEPALAREPPVARMRLDVGDHELRGKLVFGELLGKKSFMQVVARSIAGVELTASDGRLLDDIGVLAQLSDPRIWPLTVTRRIAKGGGSLAQAVTAGLATLCTPYMTGLPAAAFMRVLDRVEPKVLAGHSVESAVGELLESGERLGGVGRPVLRGDERVAPMLEMARRHGRYDGRSVTLAREVDAELAKRKGLHVNSAGFCGAILRDLGFAPDAAAAFCLVYFLVPLLTHASD